MTQVAFLHEQVVPLLKTKISLSVIMRKTKSMAATTQVLPADQDTGSRSTYSDEAIKEEIGNATIHDETDDNLDVLQIVHAPMREESYSEVYQDLVEETKRFNNQQYYKIILNLDSLGLEYASSDTECKLKESEEKSAKHKQLLHFGARATGGDQFWLPRCTPRCLG